MPLGSYTIKYATGQKWYGPEYLFGDDTATQKQIIYLILSQMGMKLMVIL
jgi:hypothetical protein